MDPHVIRVEIDCRLTAALRDLLEYAAMLRADGSPEQSRIGADIVQIIDEHLPGIKVDTD